jgi:hypothetical protein
MFVKIGESLSIVRVENTENISTLVSDSVLEQFTRLASDLKRVAPKANDFLYFSAVMMHASEASAIHDDGSSKLDGSGQPIKVGWDSSNNTLRWKTSDNNQTLPYKNANRDSFPELELIKAHKKWVNKPLCVDHKSSSIEHVRGFIVDTHYDPILKRVIALCALDRKNYPQLARQIETGVSNDVSMGTGVSKVICFDCGKTARSENEFCNHMKTHSSYCEINTELNPIELSIVVNGADQKAKIKHIIAAVQNLDNYVSSKEEQLNKIALDFNASFSIVQDQGSYTSTINAKNLEDFKKQVDEAVAKLEEVTAESKLIGAKVASEENTGDTTEITYNQSLSATESPAQANVSMDSIPLKLSNIESKLMTMSSTLNKLLTNSKEDVMSDIKKESYFQGAGGENEPTPGKVKYPVDATNDKLREDGDKHMVGKTDTGPVDGLFPGDLERKKMLARAQAEEREIKRQAVLNQAKAALQDSKAYYQGGGKENEPTPGKVKYPADKTNEMLREDKDKHMVGAKPFPGTGPVDGSFPGDQEKKKMVARASFSRNTDNLGKSAWNIYLNDKLVLTASVDQLSDNKSDLFHDTIATKEFGSKLLNKVKTAGVDKVIALYKLAQAAPAAPAPAPAPEAPPAAPAPAADAAMPAPEAAGGEEPAADAEGQTGDVKDQAVDLAEKVRDVSSDLVEAVRALTGEQAEMGKLNEPGKTASFSQASLQSFKKQLSGNLIAAMKESIANLSTHEAELTSIANMDGNLDNPKLFASISEEAFKDATAAIVAANDLKVSMAKYVRGTQSIMKRAQTEAQVLKMAQDHQLMDIANVIDEPASEDTNCASDAVVVEPELLVDDGEVDENDLQVEVSGKTVDVPDSTKEVKVDNVGKVSLNSKEDRALLRTRLAADLKMNPMLDTAHPKGGVSTKLDVKPSGDLAKVEDVEEIHNRMLDVANAPVKVRKDAEQIRELVASGKIAAEDLDLLVANGVDKDAVAYYKKYFAQVDGGSEFASELVKEHTKAEVEAEINSHKIKLNQAYALTNAMVVRGLCSPDQASVTAQVDEIMQFNDEGYKSLQRIVNAHTVKTASRMPQVGVFGTEEVSGSTAASTDLATELTRAFASSSPLRF